MGFFENRFEFGSFYDIVFDFYMVVYEYFLSVCFVGNEFVEVSVGEDEGDCVMFC